jgi:hypothetical protein
MTGRKPSANGIPGGSHYAGGREKEHAVRKYLEETLPEGRRYQVVRMAGSKGPADLIAWRARLDGICGPGMHLWIQVKKTDWKLSPGEWNKLWEASEIVGAVPLIATMEPTGPRGGLGPVFRRITGPRTPGSRLWPIDGIDVVNGTCAPLDAATYALVAPAYGHAPPDYAEYLAVAKTSRRLSAG